MPSLTLTALKCLDTEDDLGSDSCRIEDLSDGGTFPPLKRDLNDGETWPIGLSFPFNDSVTVKVWDEDWPDADDLLGTVSLGPMPLSDTVASLNGPNFHYELTYSIQTGGSASSAVQDALEA